jgi:hypothetical protein
MMGDDDGPLAADVGFTSSKTFATTHRLTSLALQEGRA